MTAPLHTTFRISFNVTITIAALHPYNRAIGISVLVLNPPLLARPALTVRQDCRLPNESGTAFEPPPGEPGERG